MTCSHVTEIEDTFPLDGGHMYPPLENRRNLVMPPPVVSFRSQGDGQNPGFGTYPVLGLRLNVWFRWAIGWLYRIETVLERHAFSANKAPQRKAK
jgi:hypothetical protein